MITLWLYAWLTTLAAPLLRLNLRKRARLGREVPDRLGERRGHDQLLRPRGPLVWLHAASVGETMSILPVIASLLRQRAEATVLVTTGTVTSAALLRQRAPDVAPPGRVIHRFVPLDVPRWAKRFLTHWRPDAVCFVESEIWPNLIRHSHKRGVPLMLINGRMSERSFRRWQWAGAPIRRLLRLFDIVQAQSSADAARFTVLGARHVTSPGNLKFAAPALPVDSAELARLQAFLAGRPLWLAASTHPGEERIAADIHRTLQRRHPDLLTIIVPRHPERGAAIAAELAVDPLPLTRRSQGEAPPPAGIWLADTLGELGLFYRLAPIVFVGRSFTVGGGQNPIEPARLSCAVAVGPNTDNFIEPVLTLRQAGALAVVEDPASLERFVDTMLTDPNLCTAMSEAGVAATNGFSTLPDQVAADLLSLIGRPA